MKRTLAATVGQETLAIVQAGRYTGPSGRVVELARAVAAARTGTRTYSPDTKVAPFALPAPPGGRPTRITVANETTLVAARRLAGQGHRVAALNFASAKNPGGGFLGGARAQEESLARASALFATLNGNPMYDFHRSRSDPMYTTWVIVSPDVPVFRDDEGALLDEPYPCSFLTSPAVNAGALRDRARREAAIRATMAERVERVLAVAASHGYDTLVLGAWGCGVFRNDPRLVAELFHAALTGPYRAAFARVAFAVLDTRGDRAVLEPFEQMFAAGR